MIYFIAWCVFLLIAVIAVPIASMLDNRGSSPSGYDDGSFEDDDMDHANEALGVADDDEDLQPLDEGDGGFGGASDGFGDAGDGFGDAGDGDLATLAMGASAMWRWARMTSLPLSDQLCFGVAARASTTISTILSQTS